MPLPKPAKGEKTKDFLDRCMADGTMQDEYPDPDQRFAVCKAQADDRAVADDRARAVEITRLASRYGASTQRAVEAILAGTSVEDFEESMR